MRHAIATVSLSGTLEEKLTAAAAARFDAVEIFEADLLYFSGSPFKPQSFRLALRSLRVVCPFASI